MWKWRRLLVELGLLVSLVTFVIGQLQVLPVQAATTDTDSIIITGTILPLATSVTTQLQAIDAGPFNQNSDISYTLNYSSDNTSTIPLTLNVTWSKGTVDGATEPSVELLNYVDGSATQAYGETVPIIDIQKRTITWSIANLPGDNQSRSVSFKLRTNDSYTGSKKVNFLVRAYVTSQVGVPDRSVNRQYIYSAPPIDALLSTITPTVSTTNISSSSGQLPANSFQAIEIRSLGAVSARISVKTARPTSMVLHYGLTPNLLTNRLLQPINFDSNTQQFVLVGLQPATQYYFQITFLTGTPIKSDIFIFSTSTKLAAQLGARPMGVILTQERTVLYTSQTAAANGDESVEPMYVIKNTVVDLNLNIPDSQTIKLVEVAIRSFSVLGASTENLNVDDLQSTTTQMIEISPGLFVGKLRTPAVSGIYQVVGRVEDNYGNITEQEIGSMQVVLPFTVTDSKTNQPLEHARVLLSIYNEKTKLYERLSNVTTTVKNPLFSGKNGVVQLSLFPGKYQADVDLPGYQPEQIYFEVGTNPLAGMPQVSLQPSQKFFGGQIAYVLNMLGHVTDSQAELYVTLSQSKLMFQLIFTLGVILFASGAALSLVLYRRPQLNPVFWLEQSYPHFWQRVLVFLGYSLLQIVGFCGEFFIVISLIFGFLFYVQLGALHGIWVLLITGALIALWSYDAIFLRAHLHPLKSSRKLSMNPIVSDAKKVL